MESKDTICYKITECMGIVEEAIKTKDLDVPKISKLLHAIRQDANRMEQGLKKRKAAMVEAGIENDYQNIPKEAPTGTNKISVMGDQLFKEPHRFEVTIKEGDKLLYQNKVRSVVLYAAEKINDFNERGEIDGVGQTFIAGHPLAVFFSFDQLIQSFEAKKATLMAQTQEFIPLMMGKLSKEARQKFLSAIMK